MTTSERLAIIPIILKTLLRQSEILDISFIIALVFKTNLSVTQLEQEIAMGYHGYKDDCCQVQTFIVVVSLIAFPFKS